MTTADLIVMADAVLRESEDLRLEWRLLRHDARTTLNGLHETRARLRRDVEASVLRRAGR